MSVAPRCIGLVRHPCHAPDDGLGGTPTIQGLKNLGAKVGGRGWGGGGGGGIGGGRGAGEGPAGRGTCVDCFFDRPDAVRPHVIGCSHVGKTRLPGFRRPEPKLP